MDITYIAVDCSAIDGMARGFVYLTAVVDWFSRRVLSWRLSITMDVSFCLDALEEALARHGKPEIVNTDQGSQFTPAFRHVRVPRTKRQTSAAFTALLLQNGIAISMDGRGAWRDNVFVERLWRSVKYEEVYLHGYDSVAEARASVGRYLAFYNRKRPSFEPGRADTGSGLFRCSAAYGGSMTSPPLGRHSGRATPSRQDDPTPTNGNNRQEIHLSAA
jgi:putative transposase